MTTTNDEQPHMSELRKGHPFNKTNWSLSRILSSRRSWQKRLKAQKVKRLFLIGDSMEPAMKNKGWFNLEEIGMEQIKELKVGDIVAYKSKGYDKNGKPSFWHKAKCVHRIVGMEKGYALIKGDNRSYTEKVAYKDIFGRIVP